MQDILPDGGVIRKLWIGEADKYREHLLRLELGEPAQPVRRRRIRRLHPQFRRICLFRSMPWCMVSSLTA